VGGKRRSLRLAIAWLGYLLAATYPADGQQTTPASRVSTQSWFGCQRPADPHRRQTGRNDQDFDLDETLARGWNDIRRTMERIGITPTASYVGALHTNLTGGPDQIWSYAGQMSESTDKPLTVTAEVAGSSPVVPAILFNTLENGSPFVPAVLSFCARPLFPLADSPLPSGTERGIRSIHGFPDSVSLPD
jgi:hypothetical protein